MLHVLTIVVFSYKMETQSFKSTQAPQLIHILHQFLTSNVSTIVLYICILCVAYPIEQIAFPELYGQIISTLSKRSTQSLFERTWKYLVGATVLLLVSQGLFTWIDYLDAFIQPKLQSYYREQILSNVLYTFEQKYKALEIGGIVSKLSKLPLVIKHTYHQVRTYIFPALVVSFFASLYFFYIHIGLGAMLLCIMVLFYAFFAWKASTCIPSSKKRDQLCDQLNESIDDTLNNLLSVYTSTTIKKEQQRFIEQQHTHDKQYTRSAMCGVDFKAWYSLFYIGIFIVINGYAFYLTHSKAIQLGQLVSIVLVTLYLINNIGDFAGEIKDFMFNIGVLNEMQHYMNSLFDYTEQDGTQQQHSKTVSNQTYKNTCKNDHDNSSTPHATQHPDLYVTHGRVEFIHVSFQYPNNQTMALDNVSLTLKDNQCTVLTGKIGSGKSTITKLLLMLYHPQQGTIMIDNQNVNNYPPHIIREHIGYVAQSPTLFNRSIYENIVYGSKRSLSKKEVQFYMKQSGVEPLFETVPHGLDSMAGKRGENLSGGQRQAIVLLRMALADRHKKIMILDEPTSALDYESKHYVIGLIRKLKENRTCIIVTHDEDVLQLADYVMRFEKGKLRQPTEDNNI